MFTISAVLLSGVAMGAIVGFVGGVVFARAQGEEDDVCTECECTCEEEVVDGWN